MQLHPILSAMRRNKVGAILIAAQMAITVAILCNAFFIIEQRLALSQRATGLDESNVFVMSNQWVGNPPDLSSRLQTDLAALRALPGVVDATVTNSSPLSNGGDSEGISLMKDQKESTAHSALYFGDEHALKSLGLHLTAGRDFTADEVQDKFGDTDLTKPAAAIISRALAEKLFPGKSALGRTMFIDNDSIPIVGIVERLQVPWTEGWSKDFSEDSTIEPFRFTTTYYHYIVRTEPGQITNVLKAAEKKLIEINRGRVLEKTMTQQASRAEAYQDDRGLAVILGVVCAALVTVTAFGIVGLTSYWVAQRRRQIGIRRALGATRQAIVRYFQTENLMIAGVGAALGIALAIALNLWMVTTFEMERLHPSYAIVGAIIVLLLGQASVLWPALKAASIPPALATRAG
jgi:putative ABC transport system permease protein